MKREFTDAEIAALDDPAQWDREHGEVVYPDPTAPHGIRLGVDLDSEAIALLEPAAERAGVSIIDYVRDAALEKARAALAAAPSE